jgi:hypothetical protein
MGTVRPLDRSSNLAGSHRGKLLEIFALYETYYQESGMFNSYSMDRRCRRVGARKDGGSPNPGISINNSKARNDNRLHLDKHYISNNFQVPFLPDILLER